VQYSNEKPGAGRGHAIEDKNKTKGPTHCLGLGTAGPVSTSTAQVVVSM
jgi:hypothetical protein